MLSLLYINEFYSSIISKPDISDLFGLYDIVSTILGIQLDYNYVLQC